MTPLCLSPVRVALAAALLGAGCAGAPARPATPDHPTLTKDAPMNAEATMPVTWFSLPADDVEKASAFYRRAFGWRLEPPTREADPDYDYVVAVSSPSDGSFTPAERGRVNGCIVKRATGITTPAVLVEVPDLDEAARKVVAAGGTVVSGKVPMRSLNGEFILVKDPDGNLLEVVRSFAKLMSRKPAY